MYFMDSRLVILHHKEISFPGRATRGPLEPGIVKLRLIAKTIVDGNYNIWLPTLEEVSNDTFFSNPSIYNTSTIPSTAAKVVRVAGYNDRVGTIAPFSGRGNPDNIASYPDIAAPAVDILTTKTGGGYDTFTGTSVAAPFATGSAALMMQWGIVNNNDPFLYGERIRAFLRLGAGKKTGCYLSKCIFWLWYTVLVQHNELFNRISIRRRFSLAANIDENDLPLYEFISYLQRWILM